jgi:hypothetical protein
VTPFPTRGHPSDRLTTSAQQQFPRLGAVVRHLQVSGRFSCDATSADVDYLAGAAPTAPGTPPQPNSGSTLSAYWLAKRAESAVWAHGPGEQLSWVSTEGSKATSVQLTALRCA